MTIDSRAAAAADSLRQSVADIQPASPPTGKSRAPLVLLAVIVIAAGLIGLSEIVRNEHRTSIRTTPATAAASVTTSTNVPGASAVGSCRSESARKVVAGSAVAEWVPLSFALARSRDASGPVFMFTGISDLGPDNPPASEGPHEPDRVVTFVGVTSLRGTLPIDLPLLVSPYQLADAQTEARPGVELVGRVDSEGHNGRRFVGIMVALRVRRLS
ncbi:MAG: hypothetical protein M3Z84_08820 [Actinomycetota bacterium]|nr:hypothetical protein [Actinomycetota bacterium]